MPLGGLTCRLRYRKEGSKLKPVGVASYRVIGAHMNVRVKILTLELLV
jgi:hypothetical protein